MTGSKFKFVIQAGEKPEKKINIVKIAWDGEGSDDLQDTPHNRQFPHFKPRVDFPLGDDKKLDLGLDETDYAARPSSNIASQWLYNE